MPLFAKKSTKNANSQMKMKNNVKLISVNSSVEQRPVYKIKKKKSRITKIMSFEKFTSNVVMRLSLKAYRQTHTSIYTSKQKAQEITNTSQVKVVNISKNNNNTKKTSQATAKTI